MRGLGLSHRPDRLPPLLADTQWLGSLGAAVAPLEVHSVRTLPLEARSPRSWAVSSPEREPEFDPRVPIGFAQALAELRAARKAREDI